MYTRNSNILLLFVFILLSCNEPLTNQETRFIEKINLEFKEKYKVESYKTIYLRVFALEKINDSDIEDIFLRFHRKSKDLRWSYVNVYNNDKEFQYQLFYNVEVGKLMKSKREYY